MRAYDGRIGELLGGKYRLEEVLGLGGMGLVYGARHQGTGRSVAIKLLRSELAAQPDVVRRVSREARLSVEAAHPNVVQVLDSGLDDDGVPYLVLERLYGTPLDSLLGTPLSRRAVLEALMPVINALVALHCAGIVHRDVKPSNLFLERSKGGRITPKLLDFGLAKALEGDSNTLSGVALGTPAYMAPEQALGFGSIGPATDVWSMAVVLVHCLTGELPFAGSATNSVESLRFGLKPEDLGGVPEPIARVLARALELEPSVRPADMLALRGELLAAIALADPGVAWPNEATISYAPGESELELALERAAHSQPGTASNEADASERLRPRPRHLVTRTLARGSLARAPGARRTALVLAVTALLAVALLALRWPGHRPQTASPRGRFAASAAMDVAAASSAAPIAAQVASGPAPTVPIANGVTRRSAAPLSRPRTPRLSQPEPKSTEPQALGANRAPIIE